MTEVTTPTTPATTDTTAAAPTTAPVKADAPTKEPSLLFDKKPEAAPTVKDKAGAEGKPVEAKEGDKSGDKPADKAADDKGDKGDGPVEFKVEDIKLPEGIVLDEKATTSLTALSTVLNDEKLTPSEKMQALVDAHVARLQEQNDGWNATKKAWADEVRADPVLGGKNLEKTLGDCNDVLRQFAENPAFGGSPEHFEAMQERLILLGLGNDKHFIRFITNIHKATTESRSSGTPGNGVESKKTHAQILWPGMS